MSDLKIIFVPDVLFPDSKYFGDGIALKEFDVGDNVKQGGLVHPI